MKTLSIRQPWAWLILLGGKDIENRSWRTNIRGRVLIHAAKGLTRPEYDAVRLQVPESILIPPFESLERGGFVGTVEITDCVNRSNSPWYLGEWGFVLKDPQPLPFYPWKGRLGFFDVEAKDIIADMEKKIDSASPEELKALHARFDSYGFSSTSRHDNS